MQNATELQDKPAARTVPPKPLGHKAYGSIPHLLGSRRGPGDHGMSDRQAAICTTKARDSRDTIIVQEKLDGSCCSVAKINGEILALQRAGYLARTSPFEQHHLFADWVEANRSRFASLLSDGERCVGEWLAQAHGTRYALPHEPFVVFDIMLGQERATWAELTHRCLYFVTPWAIHVGGPLSIEDACRLLKVSGHGALDPVEGAVWRVERNGKVDFLAKYVRPEKVDGCLLPEMTGLPAVWNWRPAMKEAA